jgi:hypothetical protein
MACCAEGCSEMNQLHRATGEWIHTLALWDLWCTFTFRFSLGRDRVREAMLSLLRSLAHDLNVHVRGVWGCELQYRGTWHTHGLLAFKPEVPTDAVELHRTWRSVDSLAGNVDVKQFDPERGAAWYLSELGDWDWYTGCPRHRRCTRRKGCREERLRWT